MNDLVQSCNNNRNGIMVLLFRVPQWSASMETMAESLAQLSGALALSSRSQPIVGDNAAQAGERYG